MILETTTERLNQGSELNQERIHKQAWKEHKFRWKLNDFCQ